MGLPQQSDDELEELMSELGRVRYRTNSAKSMMSGRASDTKPGRTMLREAVAQLEAGIKEFRARASRRAGAGHSSAALLKGLAPGVVAFVTARTVLDSIALQMPLTATANAVGAALEDERRYQGIRRAARGVLAGAKGKSGMTSLWPDLKKRLRRAAGGGKYRKRRIADNVAGKVGAAHEPWARRDRIRLGVTLVELLKLHTGLIEIQTIPRDGKRPHAVVLPTQATLNWLEQCDARNELMSPVYLPMRTRPADWTDAWTGGYRLNILARRPIVKARDPRVVDAVAEADPKIVYRAVSTVQRTAWRVNKGLLLVAKNLWDSGAPVVGFQERIDEPPPRLDKDRVYSQEELDRHTRARADWRKKFHQNRGRRVMVAKTLHLAEIHRAVSEFFFPMQADFRGRLYPIPFFLQPQGDDLARGLLEFARGKPIRDRQAADYFRGAGAGLFGVNRVAQHQRVAWAHQHHQQVVASAEDPLGFKFWMEAESPFQFLAWCFEYAAWSKAPAQFESRFRVGLDGTANGLQLYSLLTRDSTGAAATNVSPSDAPADVYQAIADRATARLMADPDPMSAQWLEFLEGRIPRAYTKHAGMTLAYDSTFHSAVNAIRDQYELDREKKGSTPFPELGGGGYRASTFLATHVWAAVGDTVGKAREAMEWLKQVAAITSGLGLPIKWVSPSGWPVEQHYTKYKSRKIQTAVGDSIRFIRYREEKDAISPVQQSRGIAANYIHSLDSAVLAFAVVRARERGIHNLAPVHDSFGILAADAPKMRAVLCEVVAELFSVDLLKDFRDGVQAYLPAGVVLPPLPTYGDLDPNDARKSQYLFS